MSVQFNTDSLARLKRAIDSANDVDGVLEQPFVQKEITALVDYQNPLRQSIPRKPGSSTEWLLNRRTAGSTVAEFVADTDSLTEDTSTYERKAFPFKTIATQGKVTRKAQAEGRSYISLLMNEITAKVDDFRDYEDNQLIKGDIGASSKQFDGLWELITDGQKMAVTTAQDGAEISLSKFDRFLDSSIGNIDMILCSRAFRRQLESKLQSQQQFINDTEIAGGFRVMTYMGIPVLPTTSIPDDVYAIADAKPSHDNLIGGTGSTSVVFALDFKHTWVGELTPFTVMPLAKVSSQYDQFDLFEDITVVLNNTLKIAALYNVKMTAQTS